MITPAYVRTMAAYNAEMNRRLLVAAATLPDAARRADDGAFFGSLHGTLCHLLWADRMWMSRFAGWERPTASVKQSPALIADFADLTTARAEADQGITAWAGTVTQDWLDGETVWFSGITQTERRAPTGGLVVHLFNHQTHHRGQAHALLTRHGVDPGDTDLWLVVKP
jgi:uncharacterized damage-inducible protein DinB